MNLFVTNFYNYKEIKKLFDRTRRLEQVEMKKLLIFGARSTALGMGLAIKELYHDCHILGFLVTDKTKNPHTLCGLPVMEAAFYPDKEIPIILAVPEPIQESVRKSLLQMEFHQIIPVNSKQESELMGRYYQKTGSFLPLKENLAEVYIARSHKDKPLNNPYTMPDWIHPIQAGAALSRPSGQILAKITDDTGENISLKNGNYCELTALYWIWKNRLNLDIGYDYYGFFQYRRILELSENDIWQLSKDQVDVVLPYPMVSEPCIFEHHERYVKDSDWNAMMQALAEMHPSFYEKSSEILHQQYMYNFNILFARKDVLRDYCAWLFPVLERTESLSSPKGSERADRYIGYLGESLLTLYFLSNKKQLKIRHTGRIILV